MQRTSNRKELISVGLDTTDAQVLRLYSNDIDRSLSETIRIISKKFIQDNNLHKKYKI